MKYCLPTIASSFVLSSAIASSYETMEVPHEDIDQHLIIGNEDNGVPENLSGLWWMKGNPLADEVISLAHTQFSPVFEEGSLVGYTGEIPVYDEGIWTFHANNAGYGLYNAAKGSNLKYVVTFNPDFTYGEIRARFSGFAWFFQGAINNLINFSMTKISENVWERKSLFLGGIGEHEYSFTRIVDKHGVRLAAYDEYVQYIQDNNVGRALIPVCTKNPDNVYPTPCVK